MSMRSTIITTSKEVTVHDEYTRSA